MSIPSMIYMPKNLLVNLGLQNSDDVHYQLCPEELTEQTVLRGEGVLNDTGVRHLCMTLTNPLGRSQFKKMRSQIKTQVSKVQLYFAGQASIPLANLISESGCVFLGTHAEIGMNILLKKMGNL